MHLLGFFLFWGFLLAGLAAATALTITGIGLLIAGAVRKSRESIAGGSVLLILTLLIVYAFRDTLLLLHR